RDSRPRQAALGGGLEACRQEPSGVEPGESRSLGRQGEGQGEWRLLAARPVQVAGAVPGLTGPWVGLAPSARGARIAATAIRGLTIQASGGARCLANGDDAAAHEDE